MSAQRLDGSDARGRKSALSVDELGLPDLLARVREGEGGCLVWTGSTTRSGTGQWRIGGKLRSAQRVVYTLVHGPMPRGQVVSALCGTFACVHPDCLVARRRTELLRGVKHTALAVQRMREGKRKAAKLCGADVALIRASADRPHLLAARFGVSVSWVYGVRRGAAWPQDTNPFTGLGARA